MSESHATTPATPAPSPAVADPSQRSAAYWRSIDGQAYEVLVRERERGGAALYSQQEKFLASFVLQERDRRGGSLDVLEFGCGFGRHARYLADVPGVRWHGYDFSGGMVEPLRAHPPPALQPLAEHLFVGDDVRTLVGARRFGLVYTVSVLIHNPPDRVSKLLADMLSLVDEGGTLCLLENQLVPCPVFESHWHDGCWLHAFADQVPEGWQLHVGHGVLATQDVYVFRRGAGARFSRFGDAREASAGGAACSREDLDVLGLPKLRSWAASAERALADAGAAGAARVADLEEQLAAHRLEAHRRRALARVSEEIAGLRQEQRIGVPTPRGSESAAPTAGPGVLWDHPLDTRWAHRDPRFARVVHAFHQEWHGIRASAGYTPGHKLALTGERELTAPELREAVQRIADASARIVVFHGYSANADALAVLLRRTLGDAARLFAVWLGTAAQLHLAPDRAIFERMLARRRRGVLEGVGGVKPGMHLLSEFVDPRTIYSMGPRVEDGPPRLRPGLSGEVFVPVPNDWRKNFYTNVYAAAVPGVRAVHVSAEFEPIEGARRIRFVRWKRPGRDQVLGLMRRCDAVLNSTLSECQPMTALEGLSVGTPCLTGPLDLGPLDAHPFARMTRVACPDSIPSVREALLGVLEARERRPDELGQMMAEYEREVRAAALDRYAEFLRL